MSKSIDERIVQMRFDNKQFEEGVRTSSRSLEDLKKGLNLDESARSLSNLEKVGRTFSLAGIAAGVDSLVNKFSTLGIIGITALQNITNQAIYAGQRMISSLTIDPIKMGFNEYETKMGAIQTILTNTQGGQRYVTKQGVAGAKETSAAAVSAIQEANEESLKIMRKTHAEKLKEVQKLADSELKIIEKKYEEESDVLKKVQKQELKDYQKLADEELKILDDKYEQELIALEKAIEQESINLKKAHQEKLGLYEEEYMQKLKVIDEERYNKIKAIDDEIKSINDLTKAEQEAKEQAEQNNKILALQNKINTATNEKDRIEAEKDLAEYIENINRKKLLKERADQIDQLKNNKKLIEAEYNQKREQLKIEYNEKKAKEDEIYNLSMENLKEYHKEQLKVIKTSKQEERDLIKERQELEREALKEQQEEKIKSLRTTYQEERDLIKERQELEREALKEKQEAEIDAINKVNRAAVKSAQSKVGSSGGGGEWVDVKSSSLEDVTKALDELNEYADKTIYNFAEMARNIGTFTAAGVDLETSVTSIKGIANLAAGSGSTAAQASTAMYQLSQAIASGSVKLQDWNSVVNAGMGGQLFQRALEKTADELGRGRNMAVSFRESLESGWITTEVLTKTLAKFADDPALIKAATQVKTFTQLVDTMRESVQSGWAKSWEYMIGDKDQATSLFTSINDSFGAMIESSANARNEMLKFWNENGGRDAIIQAISNAFNTLSSILKPIGQAFREVFPAMTGERLVAISKGIRDLTEHFKIGDTMASNIKITFKGLFSVIDIGVKGVKLLASGMGILIKALIPGSNGLLEITASIGRFLTSLNEAINVNELMSFSLEKMGGVFTLIKDIISKIGTVMGPVIDRVKESLFRLGEAFMTLFRGTPVQASELDNVQESFEVVETSSNKLTTALEKTMNVFSAIGKVVSTVAGTIKKVLTPVLVSIKDKLSQLSFQDLGALLTGGGFLMLARSLSKGITSFASILEELGNTLKAFQLKVKADALLKIAIALGILSASLIALSFIKMEDLAKSLAVLTIVFAELIGGLIVINKYVKDIKKVTTQMIALGLGMMLLSFAVKSLASMDADKLAQGTLAIAALMSMIAVFIKVTKGGDLAASAGGLTGFAIGITILSGALAILGKMKPETLKQGGIAIASLMGVIMAFINLTKSGDLAGSAGGLIGFAIGITILSGALAILGKMKVDTLQQGGIAIASLMTVIMLFINTTKGSDLAASAGGLVGFAIGISILTGALAILGKLDGLKLIQGGVAITALMGVIANFIMVTRGGDLAASAGGLIGFAVGITILTVALSRLANLEPLRLIQGGIAIVALINSIALFIKLTNGSDLAASSAGLIGFAVGLTVLTAAVKILASIDQNKIVQGVSALVVLMASIATFINLTKSGDLAKSASGLIGFSTGLMILAGVVAILSALNTDKIMIASVAISTLMIAIAAFINLTKEGDLKASAAGLMVFAIAIGMLSASLLILGQLDTSQIISAGGAITVLLLSIIAFVNLTRGSDIMASAAGLVIFSGAIMVMTKAITTLGSVDITTLAIGIGALASILVILGLTSAILAPLTPVVLALSVAISLFGAACVAIGAGMLAFSIGISNLAVSGEEGANALQISLLKIIEIIPLAIKHLALGILEFIKTIGDAAPVIARAFMQVMSAIIDTISIMTPKILNCVSILINSILKLLVDTIPNMVDSGMKLILGILRGIADNIQQVTEAGIDVILRFIKGIESKLPDIIDTALKLIITFINGLANAIRDNDMAIFNAVGNLVDAIIGSFNKLMGKFGEIGMNIVGGIISGIGSKIKDLASSAAELAKSALNSAKDALGIKSPSREFAEVGRYSAEGFANGLSKYSKLVSDKATSVGNKAIDAISNAISNISDVVTENMDMNPTIRPVLDLSDIENGSKDLNNMLNARRGINVQKIRDSIPKIGKDDIDIPDDPRPAIQDGRPIQFVQNNYSPKSLSRIDIYRQTKNQLSAMKAVVGTL